MVVFFIVYLAFIIADFLKRIGRNRTKTPERGKATTNPKRAETQTGRRLNKIRTGRKPDQTKPRPHPDGQKPRKGDNIKINIYLLLNP